MLTTIPCVGFSVSRGFGGLLSRLICRVSGSPASHAWLLYFDPVFKLHMVLEAHESGFRAVPYKIFARKNIVRRIVRPNVSIESGMSEAGAMLGEAYDFAGLFGMIVVELGRRCGRRLRNPFRSSHAQFCTEAVARVLIASSYGGLGTDPEVVDPGQLWRLFDRDGSTNVAPASVLLPSGADA